MKKITLLLLLTLSVLGLQAQTYQLNYDSIRVGKTAGTGGTSLYGKVYLKNVGLGLVSDSLLTVLNGKIRKIPVSGSISALGTSAISLGGTTNGFSYSSPNYRLHKVTATTGGVLTTGIDTIAGIKNWNTASGYAGYFNKTISTGGILAFQVSGVDKSFLEWNVNDGGSGVGTAMNLRNNQGSVGLYDNTNTGLKISGGNAAFAGTVTLADEAYSSSWNGKLEAPTKNAIWDAGFLTSASGVVLTTTDQSVAGVKTFTDSILSVKSGTNKFKVQGTGASQSASVDIHRGDRIGESTVRYFTKNDASYKWIHGIIGNSKFVIKNATTGSVQDALEIDTLNTLTSIGNIVSSKGTGTNSFGALTTFNNVSITGSLGATIIDAGNGNQLNLDNAGERFTQITTLNNGTQKASQFWDNTNTYYQIGTDVASSTVRVVAQTNGVELANGATSWSAISDLRQKKVLRPIEDALTTMRDFRTVIGRYNTDSTNVERSFLIAQDVQKTYPFAVTVGNDEDKTLRLSYTELIPLLIKAIQELEAKVKILESKP